VQRIVFGDFQKQKVAKFQFETSLIRETFSGLRYQLERKIIRKSVNQTSIARHTP